jgi:hypothetical protein
LREQFRFHDARPVGQREKFHRPAGVLPCVLCLRIRLQKCLSLQTGHPRTDSECEFPLPRHPVGRVAPAKKGFLVAGQSHRARARDAA